MVLGKDDGTEHVSTNYCSNLSSFYAGGASASSDILHTNTKKSSNKVLECESTLALTNCIRTKKCSPNYSTSPHRVMITTNSDQFSIRAKQKTFRTQVNFLDKLSIWRHILNRQKLQIYWNVLLCACVPAGFHRHLAICHYFSFASDSQLWILSYICTMHDYIVRSLQLPLATLPRSPALTLKI